MVWVAAATLVLAVAGATPTDVEQSHAAVKEANVPTAFVVVEGCWQSGVW